MDPFDPARVAASADVQKVAKEWVGKYAPGGRSARQSAGKIYTAANTLLGFISFNGLKPMTPEELGNMNRLLVQGKDLLDQGK